MIFGDIVMAAIIGASAYLQAEHGGWRNMIVTGFAVIVAFGGVVFWLNESGPDQFQELLAGNGRLAFRAATFVPFALALTFFGSIIGKLLALRLTAGRTGLAAFVLGWAGINFIYYSL